MSVSKASRYELYKALIAAVWYLTLYRGPTVCITYLYGMVWYGCISAIHKAKMYMISKWFIANIA